MTRGDATYILNEAQIMGVKASMGETIPSVCSVVIGGQAYHNPWEATEALDGMVMAAQE